ncbi:MAG TPA: putative baseplate assembly protein [Thermoanaerobaculia bacterium]|nr:putative baseplate assembly protein [Thermoanaerobaculia bacterium]
MTSPLDGLDARRFVPQPTPEPPGPSNPPGRPALRYRLDTRSGFLSRMLERLATETLPDGVHAGQRPLAALETGDLQDPLVAFLDAWALVADILTFYQERIANEGYLRTAVERRSVLEMAQLAGQEPSAGVAASAFLVFTVEDAPGSPATALVPKGTQVQSIPGQGELPQTFETGEDFTAHTALNAVSLRQARPQALAGARELLLDGIAVRLSPGDPLLLVVSNGGQVKTWIGHAASVEVDTNRQLTRAGLEKPVGLVEADFDRAAVEVFALRAHTSFFGANALAWGSLPKSDAVRSDPYAGAESNWDLGRTIWTDAHGAALSDGSDLTRPAVFLDREVPDLVAGSWAVFTGATLPASAPAEVAYRITGHSEGTRADYALSGPATGLALVQADGTLLPGDPSARLQLDVRRTTAWLASEPLVLADQPIEAPFPDPVEDGGLDRLTLDRTVQELRSGQPILVRGELTTGETVARVLLLQRVEAADPVHTRLIFQQLLLPKPEDPAARFARSTVSVQGNVVVATHGEAVAEVLGSGDGNQAFQRFALSHSPLTYVSAPVAGGRASTLEVRVNNVLWQEVENLANEGPESQSYQVEIDDAGNTAVRFGNGRQGARLPTGQENVTATYRSGIGLPGMVAADTLQLLVTRPLGIRGVTNPVPAAGAEPPADLETARANAPVAARTLGRVVSFSDFEDFARSFAGIAKVKAAHIAGSVHLTVAGVGGAAVDPGSPLYENLFEVLTATQLPGPSLSITSYGEIPFRISAQLLIDPRYRSEDVFARVESALFDAFSFAHRELEQPLYASEILHVVQSVAGVVAVDLDAFYRAGEPEHLETVLTAQPARLVSNRVLPAELIVLEAGGVTLRRAK